MCGIYGTTLHYNSNQVQRKLERTAFRGPDQMGHKVFKNDKHQISFGHNRLSIIDLDPRSNQPFTYMDVHIVFNGEIFNFQDIKADLNKKGFEFKTTSDTEVICAAYKAYGEDFVSHLNGMFAFVIYDENKQLLFGARDRMGQKPFYYYHNGKDFEFSSQLSSIQLYNNNLTISKKSIDYYLAWGNIPDPYSIFNEIKKLKAGYQFTFDINSGAFNQKQYWEIDYHNKKQFKGSYSDAKAQLNELASDATKIRLFADVPVGVFLSGGIDSSLVTALASKSSTEKIKSFSVKFNEKGFDESAYADQVAKHLDTDHQVIECNYNEGIDLIENFSHYYDEPFADSSAIPSMLLSKYTKEEVTVALSGDAGDESFIGYARYDWIRRVNKLQKAPLSIRKLAAPLLGMAPNVRLKTVSNIIKHSNTNEAYLFAMTGTNHSWIKNTEYLYDLDETKYLEHNNKNLYERVSDFDLKTYLNWDINTKVDRASMAYSLEVRAPLQDYRIIEFARSLPTEYKYVNGVMKRILKDILYEYVPKEIFDRPKAGFAIPLSEWFKNDLKALVLDELNDYGLAMIQGIKIDQVKQLIAMHMEGKANNYFIIWKLLVLKQWLTKNGKSYSIQ